MADKDLVFVSSCGSGDAGAITAFTLDRENGALEYLNRYSGIEGPFFMALSPDRKSLYSTHAAGDFDTGRGSIVAFEIDRASGSLRKINEREAGGTATCYVDVDPSGKSLVFANYLSGSVGSLPVQADGSLGEMASFIQHEGASMVDPERQEAPHAHCSVISPNGKQMFACDLGLDQVIGYSLDAETAKLAPLDQPYVRTLGGGGPRHFTYHPHGGYAYANNELDNSVNVYRHDEASGMLIELEVVSTLPDGYDELSYTADVKPTPDGRHLYCTNRLHDSITVFAIGGDGRLSLVEIQPGLGNFAQNLAITRDGKLLLCANMTDDGKGESGENVVVFRIDGESGRLTPLNEPVPLANPSCIMIA